MSPTCVHVRCLDRIRFPIDARVYNDRLSRGQSGAMIALRLAAGTPMTTAQVQERCGFESREGALQLMAELQAVWPALCRRPVRRQDGKGVEAEWYVELDQE